MFGGEKEGGEEAGPTRLVNGADASAGVAVEVFVELEVVVEVGVEEFAIADCRLPVQVGGMVEERAGSVGPREVDGEESAGEFVGDLVEVAVVAGAGGIGSDVAELVAVILLLHPRTPALGAMLALGVISGAIVVHLTRLGIVVKDDGGLLFGLALAVFVGSAAILVIRRGQIPVIGVRFKPIVNGLGDAWGSR
jgi:hypothetical protein